MHHRIQYTIMFGIIFSFSNYIKKVFNYMYFSNISTNHKVTSELFVSDKNVLPTCQPKVLNKKTSYINIHIDDEGIDINCLCKGNSPIQKQYGKCYNCNIKISDQENSKADYFAFDREYCEYCWLHLIRKINKNL